MDIIILNYPTAEVDVLRDVEHLFHYKFAEDVEAFLKVRGYNINDIHYMCSDSLTINDPDKPEQPNPDLSSPELRSIWARVGMTLYGTKEEMDKLIEDGDATAIFEKKQWKPDGNCYIPETCLDEYNEEFGENHETGDLDFFV